MTDPTQQQWAAPPPPPSGVPQHAPRRPWWKAAWFIAVLAAVVGIAIGAGATGTKTKKVAGPTVTMTATATATTVETATPIVQQVVATHTQVVRVTYTPPPQNEFSDGTQQVGPDIPAGTYKTDGQGGAGMCYFAIANSSNTSDPNSIVENQNFSGPTRITVSSGQYLETSGGCSWQRVS